MQRTTALETKTNTPKTSPGKRGETHSHDTRPCKLCARGRIPASDARKTCSTCREKKKNYYQAKKREKLVSASAQKPDINLNTTSNVVETSTVVSMKRKAGGIEKEEEEEVEDMSKVLAKMKKRLKKQIKSGISDLTSPPARVQNTKSNYIEFQTATEMYKALKVLSKSKSLHFHGSFSIVAVSSVDNSKRERLVAQELRKIAKLSFEHDKPTLLGSDLAYKCACVNHDQPLQPQPRTLLLNAIATGEPAPHKRRQSDLAVWAGLKPKSTVSSPAICTGKVLISSEYDHSHPAGIRGQRITVKIEH